ncbi:hypothetical protein [Marinobacterium lutimaris]|uniref:hypothetical protein n=1 Tax=Marinobacterium lutimaris TaxID=568106 RepID=UPI0011B0CE6A|nr:hypothetical protein [Marinobacterium lutimaris]
MQVHPKENGCTRYLVTLGVNHAWIYGYTSGHIVRDPDGVQIHEAPIDNYPAAELVAVGHLEAMR